MRMPFIEFISNGDLKFVIVFIIFSSIAITQFVKKIRTNKSTGDREMLKFYNSKIDNAAFWILISSVLSLLLGLLHSFYFIGVAGGMAPNMIFKGVSYSLITPVLGICLYIICKILKGIFNLKTVKS